MSGVGIVIRALSIGGAEKQSLLLAKALQDEFNVHLFVQKEKPLAEKHRDFLQKEKIAHTFLEGNLLHRSKQLKKEIRDKNITVLFSYLPLDNLLSAIVRLRHPLLTVIGGIRNSRLYPHKFVINRFLHRYLHDYTLFNNYSGRDAFLKRRFLTEKCLVIHNCIDHTYPEKEHVFSGPLNILSVSRFQKFKDHRTALKAVQHLREELKPARPFKYFIVGFGPQKQDIIDQIRTLQLEDCVELIESPPDVNRYYDQAHIFLSSSIYEGLPNSIMEALNHSLAVVSTNVGDTGYLVESEKNGYLVRERDFKTMAEKLNLLLGDPEKLASFGKRGYRLLHDRFSPAIFKSRYTELIRTIIDKKHGKN